MKLNHGRFLWPRKVTSADAAHRWHSASATRAARTIAPISRSCQPPPSRRVCPTQTCLVARQRGCRPLLSRVRHGLWLHQVRILPGTSVRHPRSQSQRLATNRRYLRTSEERCLQTCVEKFMLVSGGSSAAYAQSLAAPS